MPEKLSDLEIDKLAWGAFLVRAEVVWKRATLLFPECSQEDLGRVHARGNEILEELKERHL